MIRSFLNRIPKSRPAPCNVLSSLRIARLSSTVSPPSSVEATGSTTITADNSEEDAYSLSREDMPYLHHGQRPRIRNKEKFKSPRKRASTLYQQITTEVMQQVKDAHPKVHQTNFRVGDAIEIKQVAQGGVKSHDYEKIRGVVLGIFNKGLDSSVLIRDVLFGFPVERRVPLYSPLIKSIKVLEENFVFKGKRKVKRAKLYYLRDRNPLGKVLRIKAVHIATGRMNDSQSSPISLLHSDTSHKVVKRLFNLAYE